MRTTLVPPHQAMKAQGCRQPTHLASTYKKVQIWHQRMISSSYARIIRASKLLTRMGKFSAEYNPTEVYRNSEQFKSNNQHNIARNPEQLTAFVSHIIDNNFDSLYVSYLSSKQTRVVNRSKLMTEIKKKLKKIYIDFWRPYNLPSLSRITYIAILLDAKTQ